MNKIEIPFLPEFEGVMPTGKKSATTRTKRYGYRNSEEAVAC